MKRLALLLAALAASACVTTTTTAAETTALPKDAAQISTEALASLVADTAPPPEPVPARALVVPPPMTVVKRPSSRPIVSVRLVFRVGSVDDSYGREGLSALTARVLIEGGTKTLSASQLREALFPMAAELSVDTDKEYTTVQGRVHQDHFDAFLAILAEALTAPRLDPREFERIKGEQLNALTSRLRGENDEELGKAALDVLLYPAHPYRHAVVGTEQGLTATTLADVTAHAQQLYSRDRLIIGLAGPVDDALAQRVVAALSALPERAPERRAIPPAPGSRARTLILQRDTRSTAGSFGLSWTMRRDHPDYFAVALGLSYLGEHRQEHGVLFQELRDKRGLNYGTYAYAEHYRQDGWSAVPRPNIARSVQDLTVWLRPVEAKHGHFAARGVLHFLRRVLEQPLPPERFETARGFLIGATRTWTQKDQRRLGWAIDEYLYGTPDFLERYRAALGQLTAAQVQEALRKHVRPDALNLVFVTQDAAGFAQALKAREASPIAYESPKPPRVLEADQAIAVERLPFHDSLVKVQDAATFLAD